MIKTVLVLALAAGLVASPAHGASLSFSNPNSLTPISQDGILDLFDTNIGTLNRVRLTLSGTGSSRFVLNNVSGSARNVTASSIIQMYFSSSLPSLNTTLDVLMPALQLEASTGPVSVDAGMGATFGPVISSATLTLDTLMPSLFAQAGGGNFTIYCENSDEKRLDGGNGVVTLDLVTQSGCGATVEYDYTPRASQIPEPASMALLGLGMASLLVTVRRRQRRG
ncbi:MAG: PEP-CTERM sorting domain-containing protein [Zoogloea sp.]|nr:PEP-CTERM sorting domain-containing protein [Zoogloea sp.]